MLMTIPDSQGNPQTIVVQGQESVTDQSGSITATGTEQLLMAANLLRSGWSFQNLGANPMYINEIGGAASAAAGSFKVDPGAYFPPPNFPLTTAALSILGTAGDGFTARQW